MRSFEIIHGDAADTLRKLPEGSVHCCVTSPPYWGLRDYGSDEQLGLEATPDEYVANLVRVFAEVRRVLRSDGTLWLNLGDSYATGAGAVGRCPGGGEQGDRFLRQGHINTQPNRMPIPGLKPKDLVGIPWRVAFALQADGWWLRSDIIWHKPNPMPESVTDRPTKAHEYIFLLTKSSRYYYDADTIAEPATLDHPHSVDCRPEPSGGLMPEHTGLRQQGLAQRRSGNKERKYDDAVDRPDSHLGRSIPWEGATRNKRTVWTVATKPYAEAHFATFPPKLIEPCILAGCPAGGTVLDPFAGSGTTGVVALRAERSFVGIELNEEYVEMARRRIFDDAPLFNVEQRRAP